MDHTIEIQVSGSEHTGKTSMLAFLDKVLRDAGADVLLQRVDQKLDDKVENIEHTTERIKGVKVFLREMTTL